MAFPAFLLATAMVLPPDVPLDVQIIQEGSRYVLRTNDPAKSLYTYDRDRPGKSNCAGRCIALRPPLRVGARAQPVGRWTVIVRPGGVRQWAFDGKPVYTFAHDTDGRATGDGTDGVWHLLATFPAR
jgi:predicted lipoprotein with Yx(FWY)xxD motif